MLKFTEYYKDRDSMELFEECFNRFYEKNLNNLDRDTVENYLKSMFYNIKESIEDLNYDSIHYLIDILKRNSAESLFYKEIFYNLTNIELRKLTKENVEKAVFSYGLERIKNGSEQQ